jgi:hypothetical protein
MPRGLAGDAEAGGGMNAPFRPAEAVATATLTEYRPFIDGLRAVSILVVNPAL